VTILLLSHKNNCYLCSGKTNDCLPQNKNKNKRKYITMARPKKNIKLKEPVRIRERKLNDGNISLFLDIYYKGVRKYEFLKLYLIPEISPLAKIQNAETRKVAEQIKSERVLALQSHGIDKWNVIKRASMPLLHWLAEYESMTLGVKRSTTQGRHKMRIWVEHYLDSCNRKSISLEEVDKDFCRGFIKFLLSAQDLRYGDTTKKIPIVSNNTAHDYLAIFSGSMNKAVREGLIPANPVKMLDAKERPQTKEGSKEFLTIDELKKISNTPCDLPELKTAFMFACFTGLRKSDVKKMTNKDIMVSADGKTRYIYTEMVKTGGLVSIPLSAEALKWLPTATDNDSLLFNLSQSASTISNNLTKWMNAAGIKKHITFHCSRHTFGTLMLTLGADIYTTSKLMGHSNLKVTEVYAKVVDQKRVDAINLMDNMFDKLQGEPQK